MDHVEIFFELFPSVLLSKSKKATGSRPKKESLSGWKREDFWSVHLCVCWISSCKIYLRFLFGFSINSEGHKGWMISIKQQFACFVWLEKLAKITSDGRVTRFLWQYLKYLVTLQWPRFYFREGGARLLNCPTSILKDVLHNSVFEIWTEHEILVFHCIENVSPKPDKLCKGGGAIWAVHGHGRVMLR